MYYNVSAIFKFLNWLQIRIKQIPNWCLLLWSEIVFLILYNSLFEITKFEMLVPYFWTYVQLTRFEVTK
jgi:hypothetical protein